MKFAIMIIVVIGGALGMVLTNPNAEDVDAELQTQILAQIDAFDADTQGDPAVQLIAQTCKLGRSACAGILRSVMKVTIDDKVLFSRITVGFGNKPALRCIGAVTQVMCQEASN